jgi:hypothetical protein
MEDSMIHPSWHNRHTFTGQAKPFQQLRPDKF